MASQSTVELSPGQEMCHLCQLPVPAEAKRAHEKGLHHQAARQIAAVALDRWRAHMAAGSALTEPDQDADAAENITFCDICTEVVPSASFSRHLTSRPHLISALDDQVFEELVRAYIDEEDFKLLEASEQKDGDGATEKSDDKTTYICHICALQVPSAFKPEHEHSVHHKTRIALATAAARRISEFLHNQTPTGVTIKPNIKITELLKSYTGPDLAKKPDEEKNEDVIEKEVVEKASQVEIKKRLTAKQYFTDILPYLQYTEALYTIIVDDTEYVTIKNTNGTCMRVHVANFNGIYSENSNDVHYDLKCRMCKGYNHFMKYSSEKDHDKLHVMSLGHIRHVLTPIDNVHGIRKIDNGKYLCVVCNAFMPEHSIENHIFNDIHHTAALGEALKLGRNFKEGKNDLKIVIYSAPPVEKTHYMVHPVRNFPHNNMGFGGGVSFPQGHINVVTPQGPVSKPQVGLFGGSNRGPAFSSTAGTGPAFGPASASTFGSAPAGTGFGASTASTGSTFGSALGASAASTGTTFGSAPAGTGFGASTASTGSTFGSALGASTASTGTTFGSAPAGTGFGASTASTGSTFGSALGASTASTGTTFGSAPAGTGFGASTASTGSTFGSALGASTASTGTTFGSAPAGTGLFGSASAGTGFGTSNDSGASTDNSSSFGVKPASISLFGARTGSASTAGTKPASTSAFGASTANNGAFGTSTASSGGLFSTSNTAFGASTANNGAFGTSKASSGGLFSTSNTAFGASTANNGAFGTSKASSGGLFSTSNTAFGASTGAFGASSANSAGTTNNGITSSMDKSPV